VRRLNQFTVIKEIWRSRNDVIKLLSASMFEAYRESSASTQRAAG
jgi:hypothetical protein